jgi:hypothetical protein
MSDESQGDRKELYNSWVRQLIGELVFANDIALTLRSVADAWGWYPFAGRR